MNLEAPVTENQRTFRFTGLRGVEGIHSFEASIDLDGLVPMDGDAMIQILGDRGVRLMPTVIPILLDGSFRYSRLTRLEGAMVRPSGLGLKKEGSYRLVTVPKAIEQAKLEGLRVPSDDFLCRLAMTMGPRDLSQNQWIVSPSAHPFQSENGPVYLALRKDGVSLFLTCAFARGEYGESDIFLFMR